MKISGTHAKCIQKIIYKLFSRKPLEKPVFPVFKQITFEDRAVIEEYTRGYLPYSDFNFTSAYTWNVEGTHAYSFIDGQLILKLADYIAGQPVYSLLTDTDAGDTIKQLHEYCKPIPGSALSLIPEVTAQSLTQSKIVKPVEDIDNHDYIFSLHELTKLEGRRYKSKRHAANKCERENKIELKTYNKISDSEIRAVNELTEKWEQEKKQSVKSSTESETEVQALKRAFNHFNEHGSLILSLAYIDNEIVGFSVDELLVNKYVMSHYFKTLASVTGLSEYFNRYVANMLYEKGYALWNWEQDLGMIELRDMKTGYRPVTKLKKYTVIPAS